VTSVLEHRGIDFCHWEAGRFVGPPPLDALVTASFQETGQGVLVSSFQAERLLELWRMDDDADLSGPCEDTDDQTGPWATGTAKVTANDNDFDVNLTRTESTGDRAQGKVYDADGERWHCSWLSAA
jgi:hypothetical protein